MVQIFAQLGMAPGLLGYPMPLAWQTPQSTARDAPHTQDRLSSIETAHLGIGHVRVLCAGEEAALLPLQAHA